MRTLRWVWVVTLSCTAWSVGAAGVVPSVGAGGTGLQSGLSDEGARWQTRVSTPDATLRSWASSTWNDTGLKQRGMAIHGDYYFSRSTGIARTIGGFRATGTMYVAAADATPWSRGGLYALAPAPYAATGLVATPYAGLGYSASDVRSGFSFSADLGLLAPGASRGGSLPRASANVQGIDEALHNSRLAPLLQVGVSYAF